ncbi:unnamed protein product [Choristocarpus tenellus]
MSPPMWVLSIPLGMALAFIPRVYAGILTHKRLGGVDIVDPRGQLKSKMMEEKDKDRLISRAIGTHQNGLEALMMWSAAVMLARSTDVPVSKIDRIATVWVGSRIAYSITYIWVATTQPLSFLRTAIFMVSTLFSWALTHNIAL